MNKLKNIIGMIVLVLALPAQGYSQESLSVELAIQTALKNNYGILIQEKNAEISGIRNNWAQAGALPSVSFSGNGGYDFVALENDDRTTASLNGNVVVNWTLFRGFGIQISKSKLEEYEKLSEGSLAVMVENTIRNTTLAYYQILLQQENLKVAQEIHDLSKDRYEKEQQKKKFGTTVTYDLLQAKNSWLNDRTSLLSAQANLNNAIRQLNFVMSAPLETKYIFTGEFSADTKTFDQSVLQEKMLSNNNNLKNQYINLEIKKLDTRMAKSSYFPAVTTNISGGYNGSDINYQNNTVMNQNSGSWNAGISIGLSYTLFNGGQRKQNLEIARIEEEIAQLDIKDMTLELDNQLAQEYETYNVRKELLMVAEENLEAAKLNLDMSRDRFESGTINSFNYRDVQQMYLNTALAYQRAVFNLIDSNMMLMQLTGGLIEEYN